MLEVETRATNIINRKGRIRERGESFSLFLFPPSGLSLSFSTSSSVCHLLFLLDREREIDKSLFLQGIVMTCSALSLQHVNVKSTKRKKRSEDFFLTDNLFLHGAFYLSLYVYLERLSLSKCLADSNKRRLRETPKKRERERVKGGGRKKKK